MDAENLVNMSVSIGVAISAISTNNSVLVLFLPYMVTRVSQIQSVV